MGEVIKTMDFNNPQRYIGLPAELYKTSLSKEDVRPVYEQFFVTEMCGNGMRLAGIYDSDLGIFYRSNVAKNEDIVAMQIGNEEIKCRRYLYEKGNRVRIRREDGETPDEVFDRKDVKIYGVMVSLIHRFIRDDWQK